MNSTQIDYLVRHLKADGVSFDAGLTTAEVQQVEQTFEFRFPPDLRALLQTALPVSDGFVPWRWGIKNPSIAHNIIERMQAPTYGLAFDARADTFWLPEWGTKPADKWQRETIAQQHLAGYPQLIPIYSHRYLPESPSEGSPVFSVHGSDIIYYGYDLLSYFANEFRLPYPPDSKPPGRPKHIDFWSDFDEPRDIDTWGYWDEVDEVTP